MKLQLLPLDGNVFKACMHTHTTLSDGKLTPEEVRGVYKAQGYQIVAFTDHEVCVAHPELREADFLPITSYEVAINPSGCCDRANHEKCYHLNLYTRDPANTKHVCFDRGYVREKWPVSQLPVETYSEENRTYSVEYANHFLEEAAKAGFLVSYNHPNWSLQTREDYIDLKGVWGTEVYNSECLAIGHDDCQSRIFDEMLKAGIPVYPLATDDMHKLSSAFGGWIMVAAKELEYDAVFDALEQGDFYASTGPELHSLTLENGILRIACSPCRDIHVGTEARKAYRAKPTDQVLTEAELDIRDWFEACPEEWKERAFIRVTLEDEQGHRAWTRAFRRKELLEGF